MATVAKDSVECKCHHSFRKSDPLHHFKVALHLISGEVKKASCTCVAGQMSFWNHIVALLMKLFKLSLYECKDVTDLNDEDDMQPTKAYTSTLQLWHWKGKGDSLDPEPVLEIFVKKTKLNGSSDSPKEPGVNCLLMKSEMIWEHSLLMKLNSNSNSFKLILQCLWHRLGPPDKWEQRNRLDLGNSTQDHMEANS